jgi:hypothetical protein
MFLRNVAEHLPDCMASRLRGYVLLTITALRISDQGEKKKELLLVRATSYEATREFPKILCNPKVRHRILNSSRPASILSQINPVPISPSTSPRAILILFTHLRLGLPSGPFPSGFLTNNLYVSSSLPFVLYAPPISLSSTWLSELCSVAKRLDTYACFSSGSNISLLEAVAYLWSCFRITVVWIVTSCSLGGGFKRLGGIFCLNTQVQHLSPLRRYPSPSLYVTAVVFWYQLNYLRLFAHLFYV